MTEGPRFRQFFDLVAEVKRANEAYFASQGINIPASILKVAPQKMTTYQGPELSGCASACAAPISGPCAECGHDTDERDDGEWCHLSCAEDSRKARREDERLDSPLHVPYGGRR